VGKLFDGYRPELHYMRGPGPRWREKHDAISGSKEQDQGQWLIRAVARFGLASDAHSAEVRASSARRKPSAE
jgi:hypothetical protein